jgi:hypothetical protein
MIAYRVSPGAPAGHRVRRSSEPGFLCADSLSTTREFAGKSFETKYERRLSANSGHTLRNTGRTSRISPV